MRSGSHPKRAFTLLELLVTVALVAALAAVVLPGTLGTGHSTALQSAQATVANLIAVARTRALAGGAPSRILLNIDAADDAEPPRYLRYLIVQTQTAGEWRTLAGVYLPRGVYVVPGNFPSLPAELFSDESWVRGDGVSSLRSTAFRASAITTEAVNGESPRLWVSLNVAATGSTAQSGDIVLAEGEGRVRGSFAAGESPLRLKHPENVRGVSVSVYGIAALVNGRASF